MPTVPDPSAASAASLSVGNQERELISALYDIGELSLVDIEVATYLAAIHNVIARLMYAENFFVAITDREQNTLSFPYFVDTVDQLDGSTLNAFPVARLKRTLTGVVLRSGRPLLADQEKIAALAARGEIDPLGSQAIEWLGVPLRSGNQILGVMVVQTYDDRYHYSGDDQLLLFHVSRHIAMALQRLGDRQALHNSNAELKRVNAELEIKVQERTNALHIANEHLIQQLDESEALRIQLLQAKDEAERANNAKSLFLANMSHEIRTPLNAILGFAQILVREPSLTPKQRQHVSSIDRAGSHLLELINDILDLSKIEAGKMELNLAAFDLADMARGVAALFAQRCENKGLLFVTQLNIATPTLVVGDEHKLRQILFNLLGNAVKFTERGQITLTLSQPDEQHFHFAISDTGPGIARSLQAAIFEPFRQAQAGQRKGGTGLGLAITRRQINLMGSEIALTSESGQGACFEFRLQLPTATSLPRQHADNPLTWHTSTVRALIVDDVSDNREILHHLLQSLGIHSEMVDSGFEALRVAQETSFDIIFLDIRMPQMDGFETLKQLHARLDSPPPCVAITASTLTHQTQTYQAQGFADFIAKPFRFETVVACLQKQLHLSATTVDAPNEPLVDATHQTANTASAPITLAAETKKQLLVAIETCRASAVEQLLLKISEQDHAPIWCQQARLFLRAYDFDGLKNYVEKTS